MYKLRCFLVRRRFRGFTLLEMALVLLIISILVAIAVPAFLTTRERSRARACINNLRHIQDAKENWAMEHQMPSSAFPGEKDLVPAYIKNYPSCPGGGTYKIGSVGDDVVCSVGGDHSLN